MRESQVAVAIVICCLSGCWTSTPGKPPPKGGGTAGRNTEDATVRDAIASPVASTTAPTVAAASSTSEARFVDVADQAGVKFAYSNGREANEYAILESLGGGLGVLDYDLDGAVDVMFAGGGKLDRQTVTSRPCGLYRNRGGFQFVDATSSSLSQADRFYTHAVYPADVNEDGFEDLSISGYGGVQVLLNQGDGTFLSLPPWITDSQLAWSSSLAWADLDQNGLLDLYVAHYVNWSWNNHPKCIGGPGVPREVCTPKDFAGITDAVYWNDGQMPLRREADEVGLVKEGKGLGVVVGDLNSDHHPDIYVANDTVDNFLYINDGHGKFTESAVLAGVSGDDAGVSTGSMGVFIFDSNQDQLPDLFVTNFERELSALYRNEGAGFYTFASRQAGFAAYDARFVGFGTVCLDFDFDGDQDIIIANGHVSYHSVHAPYRQLPLLFENQAGKFRAAPPAGFFAQPHTGRGIATADFDNDGAVDFSVSHLEEPVSMVRHRGVLDRNWAICRLIGTRDNRSAIGASLSIVDEGQTFLQYLYGGGSYLSSSDRRLHVYWPANQTTATVSVLWPNGESEQFVLSARGEQVLVQGRGRSTPPPKGE